MFLQCSCLLLVCFKGWGTKPGSFLFNFGAPKSGAFPSIMNGIRLFFSL